MDKKGFTLIEVIAVIAILGFLATIVTPKIMSNYRNKKDTLYETTVKEIERISSMYLTNNPNLYQEISNNGYTNISINSLCMDDLISCPVKDPRDDSEINGYVKVSYENDKYEYEFINEQYINENIVLNVELNGGSISDNPKGTYKEGELVEIGTPTKEDCVFVRWEVVKGNSKLDGNRLVIGSTNTILYAVWEKYSNLVIDLDGGVSSTNQNGIYKSGTIIKLDEPTKEGYTFIGWTGTNSIISGNVFVIGYEDVTLTAKWEAKEPVSFETDDWVTIVRAVKQAEEKGISYPYNVGDEKTVEMDINGDDTAEEYTIRVANKTKCSEVEVTSKTACGFVLEFADIITTHAMNGTDAASSTNLGGWPASEMRKYLNDIDENDEDDGVIYNALPEELRAGIIDTYVVSSHGDGDTTGELENDNFGSTDKLYLLSSQEVYGTSFTSSSDTSNGTSRQLDYYAEYKGDGYTGVSTTNYAGAIKNKSSGSASYWWLRSAYSNASPNFYRVDTSGGWGSSRSDGSRGVSPAFRLAE